MNAERALFLLNAVIEHMLIAERVKTVLEDLVKIGFTKEELLELNFTESDIDDAMNEGDDDEDDDD